MDAGKVNLNNVNGAINTLNAVDNKKTQKNGKNVPAFGFQAVQNYAAPAYAGVYGYSQTPYYQYPQYSAVKNTPDINTAIRAGYMPLAQSQGFKDLGSFDAPHIGKGKFYQLDNGQNVIIIPKKGHTTIKTFVKTGSFNEEKNRGISHYIEHNLFNGSKTLAPNEFVEKVISMGGQYNASTNTMATDYFVKSPMHREKDFDKFLEMHADMLQNPTFTDKMLEKEKGPVISEIQMYEDDTYDKAYNLMLKNLFGIKTDYQGLIAGDAKTIANLTRKDVFDYYNEWYQPNNMTTVIVGEVEPETTIRKVGTLFNQKQSSPPSTPENHYYEKLNLTDRPIRQDIKSNQTDAVILNMAFAGPKNSDIKDTTATMALIYALTGHENARLQKTLKNFNTSGSADLNVINPSFDDPQLLTFGTTFSPGKEEEGLKSVYSTMQSMAQYPLSDEELFIVKNKMKNTLTLASEDSMGVANLVGQAVTGKGSLNAYTEIPSEIDSLTAQDIQRAAQKYLDLNRISIVMVHPETKMSSKALSFGSSESINSANSGKSVKNKPSFSGNSAGESDKFKFQNIKEFNLQNNMRLAINDNPYAIRSSASLMLQTPDLKTIKPGTADILTLMINKGSRNYSEEQLNRIKDRYNVGLSISADDDSVILGVDCPKEALPFAMSVMKEVLYNPDFTEEKFQKAKEEIKVQYSSSPKDPANKAMEVIFPDHPMGNTPKKILENLDNVTIQDVYNLYGHIISDSSGRLTVDAPLSNSQGLNNAVYNQAANGFFFTRPYTLTNSPESKPLQQPVVLIQPEERNQADIVQIFKIKESKNIKDAAALTVLNQVLGGNSQSKLFTDLRESQKLAYRVKSLYTSDGNYGTIKLLIKTTTENGLNGNSHMNVQKSLDGFKKHINSLITNPVGEEELETAKLEAKTHFLDGMDSSFGRVSRIQAGLSTPYGTEYHNQMLDAIDSLSASDIQNAAAIYLNQPSVISIIAGPKTLKEMKPYLQMLGEVKEVSS